MWVGAKVDLVVGVDIGMRSVALSVFENGLLTNIEVGSVPQTALRGDELFFLAQKLRWLGEDGITTYVEEPPMAGPQNKRTFLHLGQTCGMILSVCSEAHLVPVSTWKKQVVGAGNATKDDVAHWLLAHSASYHALCDGDQNRVDAICIGLYGVQIEARAALIREVGVGT